MNNSKKRSFAVVTGASSGIGKELARVFAQHGFDLLVTSHGQRLESAIAELEPLGVEVRSVHADLATYEGVEKLVEEIRVVGRPLDAIALNAGVGVGGDFARETALQAELNLIQLNVTSTVHLAKGVLPDMVARRSGRMLFTSSIAGTMPTPLEAVYGASKAFVLSFARSLRAELKDSGITVTTLMPGATNTDFFRRAGMEDTKVGSEGKYENDPLDVAKQGFDALLDGDDHVFSSSWKTKIQGEVGKFVPESVKAEMHRKQAEPKKAKG